MSGGLPTDPSVTNPVGQSGVVTPGHLVSWTTDGVVQDAGSAATTGPYLPLIGGTLQIPGSGSSVLFAPVGINQTPVGNSAQIFSYYNADSSATEVGTGVVSNIRAETAIHGATNAFYWSVLAIIDYSGTGGDGQYVPIYGQGIRRVANAGGGANNPQIWGGVLQTIDFTNTDSALTNALTSLEIDMNAGNTDSAGNRSLITLALNKAQSTDVNPTCHTGIGMYTDTGTTSFDSALRIWVPYNEAAIDFRSANQLSGYTIWFGNNAASIAWRNAGDVFTYWDGAAISGAGAVHFNGNVQIDGTGYFPNNVTVGGLMTALTELITSSLTLDGVLRFGTLPVNAVDDAAAALAGVGVGQVYRNGSVMMIRVT